MKRFIGLLVLTLITFSVFSQRNLIPNGRFEEVNRSDTCMVGGGFPFLDYLVYHNTHYVKYWWDPRPFQSFYFNDCDTNTTFPFSVPHSGFGDMPDPNGGHAYAGLITWNNVDTSALSCIEVQLDTCLVRNHHYLFKMKVAPLGILTDRSTIGICFEKDSEMIYTDLYFTPHYPAYTYTTDSVIKDCSSWQEVVFHVNPTMDSLRYIVLGSFPTIAPIRHIRYYNLDSCYHESYDSEGAMTIIDDVQLYDLDTQIGINEVDAVLLNILISPNPAHDKLTIQTANFSKSFNWNLYDMQGRLIQAYAITRKEQEITLPENMAAGMYYWRAFSVEEGFKPSSTLNCGKLLVE